MGDDRRQELAYVDFSAWAERRNLIAHLLRNTSEAVYLRGLPGSGKSRFCGRLLEELAIEFNLLSLVGDPALDVPQAASTVRSKVVAQDSLKPFLIAVDDADQLTEIAHMALKTLHADGARLLFCGRGELVPPIGGAGLRMIDLPAMSREQSDAFLAKIDPELPNRLGEVGCGMLHKYSGGLPGKLIERVEAITNQAEVQPESAKPEEQVAERADPADRRALRPSWIAAVVLIGTVMGVVIWQQERINQLFEPPRPEAGPAEAATDTLPPPLVDISTDTVTRAEPSPLAAETVAQTTESYLAPQRPDLQAARKKQVVAAAEVDAPSMAPAMPVDVNLESEIAAADPSRFASVEARADVESASPGELSQPADEPTPVAARREVVNESLRTASADRSAAVEAVSIPERTPPPPPEPESARDTTRDTAVSSKADAPGDLLPGADWLAAQPAGAYTLQLMGGRNLSSLKRVIVQNRLTKHYAIVVRDLKGRPWYSLIYGSFDDLESATAQKEKSGLAIAKEAWPRKFSSIRK